MKKTDKAISDQECRQILFDIIKIIINTYHHPIRPLFERQSRMAQCGYDIIHYLIKKDVIAPGEGQEKLEL